MNAYNQPDLEIYGSNFACPRACSTKILGYIKVFVIH